jgi:hypothetical protein
MLLQILLAGAGCGGASQSDIVTNVGGK